jgi:signal transduction histidine kinase
VKGTGLGLFIVKAIARKHGGKVFAASDGEGKGTTITIELPRVSA